MFCESDSDHKFTLTWILPDFSNPHGKGKDELRRKSPAVKTIVKIIVMTGCAEADPDLPGSSSIRYGTLITTSNGRKFHKKNI